MSYQTHHRHLDNGPLLALGSAFLFGASTPIAKLLLGIADPLLLAGLLYLGSGSGLALVKIGGGFLGLGRSEAPLRPRDLPWLASIVLFGGILGPALLMWGLTVTPASTCSTSRASPRLRLPGLSFGRMSIAGYSWVPWRSSPARSCSPGRERAPGRDSTGRRADRPRLRIVGHRQQSHPQAQRGRSAADCHDQGIGRRRSKFRDGARS